MTRHGNRGSREYHEGERDQNLGPRSSKSKTQTAAVVLKNKKNRHELVTNLIGTKEERRREVKTETIYFWADHHFS